MKKTEMATIVNSEIRVLQEQVQSLKEQLSVATRVKPVQRKKIAGNKKTKLGRKHLLIPDCQVKPAVPTDHLEAIGNYAAEKQPDVIWNLGDFGDMPSLSSWDKGKKQFEGRRYRLDIEATIAGMERLMTPIIRVKNWDPEKEFLLGNHENRIQRAVDENAMLEGTISVADLQYEKFGWRVHPFLKPHKVDGVTGCHFFPRASSGKVMQAKNGAPTALAQLRRQGGSCVSGHTQGFDIACLPLDGRLQWGIIAGSCYMHTEDYLTPQGNDHWNGVIMLHEVIDGQFSPMVVSLEYLLKNYL